VETIYESKRLVEDFSTDETDELFLEVEQARGRRIVGGCHESFEVTTRPS